MMIKFKGTDRKQIENYLKLNDDKKSIIKQEKTAKETLASLFVEYGVSETTTDSTMIYWGYVQEKGENVPVVMKNTVKSGAIDWQEYALALQAQLVALGETPADPETFRKEGTVTTTIERMSKTMRKQLGI